MVQINQSDSTYFFSEQRCSFIATIPPIWSFPFLLVLRSPFSAWIFRPCVRDGTYEHRVHDAKKKTGTKSSHPAQKLIKPVPRRCSPGSAARRRRMRGPVVLVFHLRGVADEPCVAHVVGGADAGSAEEFVGDEDGEEEEGLFFLKGGGG